MNTKPDDVRPSISQSRHTACAYYLGGASSDEPDQVDCLRFCWRRSCRLSSIAQEKEDPSQLTVQRIFGGGEFEPEHLAIRWLAESSGYVTLEPSSEASGGRDLVSHDPASGEHAGAGFSGRVDSAEGIVAAFGRGLRVLARSIAAARFHQQQTRLARQHAGRLLGARPGGPRAAEAGRRRGSVVAHARQVLPRADRRWPTCARTTSTSKTWSTAGSPS